MKNSEQKYILFGEFPQTIKSDSVEIVCTKNEKTGAITYTQDDRGYYLGSDGAYYAKIMALPYNFLSLPLKDSTSEGEKNYLEILEQRYKELGEKIKFLEKENKSVHKLHFIPNVENYKFSNGKIVSPCNEYYFKVEPIKWLVMGEDKEKMTLISELALDTPFSVIPELPELAIKYAKTNEIVDMDNMKKIDKWSRMVFFPNSFSQKDIDSIKNGVEVISAQDLVNSGIDSNKKPTDFALANGVAVNAYYKNTCEWWLNGCSCLVYYDGIERKCNFRPKDYWRVAVVPMLTVKKQTKKEKDAK